MSDFWIGFSLGVNAMASVVLLRMWWRGELSPKWPNWM